jgi:hypothetical protein
MVLYNANTFVVVVFESECRLTIIFLFVFGETLGEESCKATSGFLCVLLILLLLLGACEMECLLPRAVDFLGDETDMIGSRSSCLLLLRLIVVDLAAAAVVDFVGDDKVLHTCRE